MGHRRNHVFLPRLGFSLPGLAEAPGWLCPFLNFPPHRRQRRRSSQALSATLSESWRSPKSSLQQFTSGKHSSLRASVWPSSYWRADSLVTSAPKREYDRIHLLHPAGLP